MRLSGSQIFQVWYELDKSLKSLIQCIQTEFHVQNEAKVLMKANLNSYTITIL